MTKPLLLYVGGRGGHGKSTLAKAMQKRAWHRGLTAEIVELSDFILAEAQSCGRIEAWKSRKDCTPEDVAVLIEIGERRRNEDPDYWVGRAAKAFEQECIDVVITPNLRLPHEANYCEKRGGVSVKVVAINPCGSEYISPSRDPNSALEGSLTNQMVDYVLFNPLGEPDWLIAQGEALFDYLWDRRP